MTQLLWGRDAARTFETGIDRGVLYPETGPGVAWEGLVAVNESPTGGESTPFYLDGVKYLELADTTEYAASIEAFTYPDEFERCQGVAEFGSGLFFDDQPRESFGFAYRTLVGNALQGQRLGYKLHLVYNALATPTQKSYGTISDSTEAMNFSWDITTTPIAIPGHRATSHLVLDSRTTAAGLLWLIESILYGSEKNDPRMVTPEQLFTWFSNPILFRKIVALGGGLDPLIDVNHRESDLFGPTNSGLYKASPHTHLIPTAKPGLYKLE